MRLILASVIVSSFMVFQPLATRPNLQLIAELPPGSGFVFTFSGLPAQDLRRIKTPQADRPLPSGKQI
jgi:hypothetical protein